MPFVRSLTELKRLTLSLATFTSPAEPSSCPASLKNLDLDRVDISIAWLTTFLAELPKLTTLKLTVSSVLDSKGSPSNLADMQR